MSAIDPVRVCCGQHHSTVECPDGRVMCCICFERVGQQHLAEGPEGYLVDICEDCYEEEDDDVR